MIPYLRTYCKYFFCVSYFHATYFHPHHSDCYIKPQPLFYIILISPAIHLSRVSRYRCNVSESP